MAKKKTKLTAEQRKAYIRTGGDGCPFCKDISIDGSSWDINGTIAYQTVMCCGCGAEWMDEYRLCNIVVLHAPN